MARQNQTPKHQRSMNKFCLLFSMMICVCALGADIDINPDRRNWHIELKRIAANFSSTSIRNQEPYEGFSDSRITGDSQLMLQGFFDLGIDFYAPRYVIFNSIDADYGRTIIYPKNEPKISNRTSDRIILSSDYTHRIWYIPRFIGGFEIGPFIKLNYQTEFDPPAEHDRRQIVRGNGGIKFFDGLYLKDLHLNIFGEKDFAITTASESLGWEGGIKIEYALNKYSKIYYYTNFRHYIHNSAPATYNPLYQLEIELRVDSKFYKKTALAPFVKYYALQGRDIKQTGSSLLLGFSFSLGYTFIDATKKPFSPISN